MIHHYFNINSGATKEEGGQVYLQLELYLLILKLQVNFAQNSQNRSCCQNAYNPCRPYPNVGRIFIFLKKNKNNIDNHKLFIPKAIFFKES